MDENKARVLVEKKTAINLLEAFAVAIKHYLRGEFGIYYADLYHLVKFLPPYARSLIRTSAFDFPSMPNYTSNVQATSSPPQGSLILHKAAMPRRQASSTSSVTMVPPKASASRQAFSLYQKPNQTQTFNSDKTLYPWRTNEEDFLLPARMPPRFSFIDLFPFFPILRYSKIFHGRVESDQKDTTREGESRWSKYSAGDLIISCRYLLTFALGGLQGCRF